MDPVATFWEEYDLLVEQCHDRIRYDDMLAADELLKQIQAKRAEITAAQTQAATLTDTELTTKLLDRCTEIAKTQEPGKAGFFAIADIQALVVRYQALYTLVNTPELVDFPKAVQLEAAHQRERWGTAHDAGKAPEDWYWLIGYLAGKALRAALEGRQGKALHHTISTAAALSNWHAALLGATDMRPGIGPGSPGYREATLLAGADAEALVAEQAGPASDTPERRATFARVDALARRTEVSQ